VPVALAISVGNTLEAVVGRELLARVRFRPSLERVRDVLALVVLGAAASTAASATNGVTTLWVAGDLSGLLDEAKGGAQRFAGGEGRHGIF